MKKWTTLFVMAFMLLFAAPSFAAESVSLSKAAVYNSDAQEKSLSPVMLLSYYGEDYYLTPNDKAKELEKLVEHTINVKGTVTKDAEGRNVLTITEYQEAFN